MTDITVAIEKAKKKQQIMIKKTNTTQRKLRIDEHERLRG